MDTEKSSFNRRSFLKVAAGSGAALVAGAQAMSAQQQSGPEPDQNQGVVAGFPKRWHARLGVETLGFREVLQPHRAIRLRRHRLQQSGSDPYCGGNANFIGWDRIGYPGIRTVVTADDQRVHSNQQVIDSDIPTHEHPHPTMSSGPPGYPCVC